MYIYIYIIYIIYILYYIYIYIIYTYVYICSYNACIYIYYVISCYIYIYNVYGLYLYCFLCVLNLYVCFLCKDDPPAIALWKNPGPLLGCAEVQKFHLEVGDESARQVPWQLSMENIGKFHLVGFLFIGDFPMKTLKNSGFYRNCHAGV